MRVPGLNGMVAWKEAAIPRQVLAAPRRNPRGRPRASVRDPFGIERSATRSGVRVWL